MNSGIWDPSVVGGALTHLLGDVLRIFGGDSTAGQIEGKTASQVMYLGIAVLMLIPIVMVVVSLTLTYPAIRWVSLVASAFLVFFNLAGLPYDGVYDNFLIVIGLVFNSVIVWYAWTWQSVA